LLENKTLQSYSIRIVNENNVTTDEKILQPNSLMPLPESYNQSKLQIKLLDNKAQVSHYSSFWGVYEIKNILSRHKPGHLKHGT
jgi:hypothetical protein